MNQFLSFTAASVRTELSKNAPGFELHPADKLHETLQKLHKNPTEMYYSQFAFDAKTVATISTLKGYKGIHGLSLGILALDFDSKDDITLAMSDAKKLISDFKLTDDQYALFESGNKGFHLYLSESLFGTLLAPSDTLSAQITRLAVQLKKDYPTLDLKVYSVVNKFRAPGSKHPDTDRLKQLIDGSWPLGLVARNEALESRFIAANMVSENQRPEVYPEGVDGPAMIRFKALRDKPCVSGILNRDYPGKGNNTLLLLVSDLKHSGHTDDQIRKKLRTWMLRNNPDDRFRELEGMLERFNKEAAYVYYCDDPTRSAQCSKECPIHKDVSGETLAKMPIPADADEKTIEKIQEKTALIRIKKFAEKLLSTTPIKYVHDHKTYYEFDGEKYVEQNEMRYKGMLEAYMPAACNNKNAGELIGALARRCNTPIAALKGDQDKYINFKNGHFNKETGTLEPRISSRFFTYCLPFNYEPRALAPRFQKFLTEFTSSEVRPKGNEELKLMVLEFVGYTLSGDEQWAQTALFLIGEGHNGKSKLMELVSYMVGGDANFSAMPLAMLAIPERLPALENKLGNLVPEEAPESFRKCGEAFKALCTNDTVTARRLGGQPYQFKTRAKMWVSLNNAPHTNDTSYAFFKRMLMLPCDARMVKAEEMVKFIKKDTGHLPDGHYIADAGISQKLQVEAPGIFNLAWGAYQVAKKAQSLTQAEASVVMKEEFVEESSLMQLVLKDTFTVRLGSRLSYPEILKEYARVMKNSYSASNPYLSMRTILKELERVFGYQIKKVKSNSICYVEHLGIGNPGAGDGPNL